MTTVQRLVDLVFMFQDEKFDEVADILKQVGCKTASSNGIILTSAVGDIRVGIPRGLDPINTLVQISFAIYGERWPFSDIKAAFKAVHKIWKQRLKEQKTKREVAHV